MRGWLLAATLTALAGIALLAATGAGESIAVDTDAVAVATGSLAAPALLALLAAGALAPGVGTGRVVKVAAWAAAGCAGAACVWSGLCAASAWASGNAAGAVCGATTAAWTAWVAAKAFRLRDGDDDGRSDGGDGARR